MQEPNSFSKEIIKFIRQIPKGRIATYGQIAKLAGKPQGSRGVAWILNSSSEAYDLPWQRVVNSKGQISFPIGTAEFNRQKRLLVKEGVEFTDKNQIDLKKFQWKKEVKIVKKKVSSIKPQMFS